MNSIGNLFLLLLLLGVLSGCLNEDADINPSENLFEEQQQIIEQYLSERNIATRQNAAGIHYRVLNENANGASPQPGNIINLYYHIEQLGGGLIDAHEDSSGLDPITYTFDFNSSNPLEHHLILPVSLDSMVTSMREGEEYEFYLPSGFAYLDYSLANVISPNAVVCARLHLAKVLTPKEQRLAEDAKIKKYLADEHLQDADSLPSGVYYLCTQPGEGPVVSEGNKVQVRYTGSLLNGTVFDSNTAADRSPLEFTVEQNGAVEGFLTGVKQMKLGEKGTVVMPSHTAYGQGLIAIPYTFISDYLDQVIFNPRDYNFARQIRPYSPLRFDIEVVAIN